jgi:hypothetical protein
MGLNGDHLTEDHIWVPDIYRNVLIDDANPTLQALAEQAKSVVSISKEPRVFLLTSKEALMISRLGNSTVNSVNQVIESGLPETIADELDVMTTGLRIRANSERAIRFLTLGVTSIRLFQERQLVLESLYDSVKKLPPFFKDFCWEVVWGPVSHGIDSWALPGKLEEIRPGLIRLGPAVIRKPNK